VTGGADEAIPEQLIAPGGKIAEPDHPTRNKQKSEWAGLIETETTSDLFDYWYAKEGEHAGQEWLFDSYTVPAPGALSEGVFRLYAKWVSNSEEPMDGTAEPFTIGDPMDINLSDYSNAGCTEEYFNYTYVAANDNVGVPEYFLITGVKSGVENVWIPMTMSGTYNGKSYTDIDVKVSTTAFKGNTTLKSVRFMGSRQGYPTSNIFSGCTSLEYVYFGDVYLKDGTIGESAFYNCTALKCVVFPKGVTTFGSHSFYRCNNISSVVIPDGITTILSEAISYCVGIDNLVVPKSATIIGSKVFYRSEISCLDIASNISINYDMFRGIGCVLDTLILRKTVLSIPMWFNGIEGHFTGGIVMGAQLHAKHIIIEEGIINEIPKEAFWHDDYLEEIELPKTIRTIGISAFHNCSKLKSIKLKEGLINILDSAFSSCNSLEEIVLPSTVENYGDYIFSGDTNVQRIELGTVNDTIRYAFSGNFTFSNLKELVIQGNTDTIPADMFYHYDVSMRSMRVAGNARLVIGEGIKSIGANAFSECKVFSEVFLPPPSFLSSFLPSSLPLFLASLPFFHRKNCFQSFVFFVCSIYLILCLGKLFGFSLFLLQRGSFLFVLLQLFGKIVALLPHKKDLECHYSSPFSFFFNFSLNASVSRLRISAASSARASMFVSW